ncbi:hypothetical protein [uncultured Ruminococcus sp.]|uniref:hypothetical protein n=1 Tax=uncultured Ruminococcus sp. TaxID=165186 RepID=UPI0025E30C9A|nr:hypothetical protein [uncultured Ruminococcus sp.]
MKPDLSKIKKKFELGDEFSLTEKQYQKLTGASIPKDGYYLIHKSAVAKAAKEKGFKVVVKERTIIFEVIDN